MKSCRRLIQNINRLSCSSPAQLCSQLNSLSLSAGKLCGWLPQTNIRKPHIIQCRNLPINRRNILKEAHRLLHRHIQDIVNAFSLIANLQSLPIIPLSAADLTGYIDIRKKMHLNLDNSVAAAGLTPAAFYIKTEAPLIISLCLCIRGRCKQIPDHVKHTCIGSRI